MKRRSGTDLVNQYVRSFDALVDVRAWDIRLPGFIDRDGPIPCFTPMASSVYIVLTDGLLRLQGDENGQLTIRLVGEPEFPSSLEGEEEEFSLASHGQQFLAEAHSSFRITRIRCVVSNDAESEKGEMACIEFEFEENWRVFADPGYFFGIRLEGEGGYERWLHHHQSDLKPEGPLQEIIWSP
ncbi:hypothetical protein ABZ726_11850 [Streptomyces hundungensis]|uniref:hypothetical protein n=1 Tax=Streptomyces hundungensis TaxID=1077946 RepID=UPI0033EEE34C